MLFIVLGSNYPSISKDQGYHKGWRFEVRKYFKNVKVIPKDELQHRFSTTMQHGYLGIASDGDCFDGNFIWIYVFKLEYLF